MSSKTKLRDLQRAWAIRAGARIDARGYLPTVSENLFQPLSRRSLQAFSVGSGAELRGTKNRPPKMMALHSSAALAVNVFDYWTERPADPLLRSLKLQPEPGTIEFESQFPTGLDGNPPNLDVAIRFDCGLVVGVESKFSEWLTPKSPKKEYFKPKYFPKSTGLWSAKAMPSCQALAASLYAEATKFRHLDVAQLLKHVLGLASQHSGKFVLYYLYFEWPGTESSIHREELVQFESLIGSDFRFHWGSYQEVYQLMGRTVGEDHAAYTTYLRERYFPNVV